jgi:hypothetical protein
LKKWKDETTGYIQDWSAIVADITTFTAEEIEKAFKSFWKTMEEPNNYVVLQCAKRRMTINFTKNYRKNKLKFSNWFYNLYPSNRHF